MKKFKEFVNEIISGSLKSKDENKFEVTYGSNKNRNTKIIYAKNAKEAEKWVFKNLGRVFSIKEMK